MLCYVFVNFRRIGKPLVCLRQQEMAKLLMQRTFNHLRVVSPDHPEA